jgi:hypothetical protein
VVRGFGTARDADRGRPASASPSAPCGLSAVPRNSPSCPTCSLAVVAFPPRSRLASTSVGTVFRRPFGTVRPSDFFRPFVISFFRSRQLPLAAFATAEAERSPRVRNAELRAKPSPLPALVRRILGVAETYGASLSLGSALRLQTSIRHPLAGARRRLLAAARDPVLRAGALVVGVGFPPSGSPTDLIQLVSNIISPSVLRPCRAHCSLRCARLGPPKRCFARPPTKSRDSWLAACA